MRDMTRRNVRHALYAVALGATIGFLLAGRTPPPPDEEELARLRAGNPTKPTDDRFSKAIWGYLDTRMGDTSAGLPEGSRAT